MSAHEPESGLSVIISAVLIVLALIAIVVTEPSCLPGEKAMRPRFGGWVCARTP